GYESPAYLIASALQENWPNESDMAPLLDLVLATEAPLDGTNSHHDDWAVSELAKPIRREGANISKVLDRVVEAFLAGEPGRWRVVHCRKILEHAPVELVRDVAERAFVSEDDDLATWALQQLLGRAHDPARDGSRGQLVARLWEVPRYRRLLQEDYEL